MSWFRLVPQKLPSLPAETHESPPSSLLHAPRCATVSHDSACGTIMPPPITGMPPPITGMPTPITGMPPAPAGHCGTATCTG